MTILQDKFDRVAEGSQRKREEFERRQDELGDLQLRQLDVLEADVNRLKELTDGPRSGIQQIEFDQLVRRAEHTLDFLIALDILPELIDTGREVGLPDDVIFAALADGFFG